MSIKVGDLIKLQYAMKNPYDQSIEGWGDPFIGVIVEVPSDDRTSVLKMYCFDDMKEHILMPEIDLIEVISCLLYTSPSPRD